MLISEILFERKSYTRNIYNDVYEMSKKILSKHKFDERIDYIKSEMKKQLQAYVDYRSNASQTPFENSVLITLFTFDSNTRGRLSLSDNPSYKWNINLCLANLIMEDGDSIDVEKSAKFIAAVFSHEYLHMIQRSNQLKKTNILSTPKHSQIKNSKISTNYRASANEIHAFATDSARDLCEYYGSAEEALKHLTSTSDINKAADISIAFRGYYKLKNEPDGNVLFNQFLKEIVQQLNAIITDERLEKEFNSP